MLWPLDNSLTESPISLHHFCSATATLVFSWLPLLLSNSEPVYCLFLLLGAAPSTKLPAKMGLPHICADHYAIRLSLGATVFGQHTGHFPLAVLLILFLFGIFNAALPTISASTFSGFPSSFLDLIFLLSIYHYLLYSGVLVVSCVFPRCHVSSNRSREYFFLFCIFCFVFIHCCIPKNLEQYLVQGRLPPNICLLNE